jgi:hypothetical protein
MKYFVLFLLLICFSSLCIAKKEAGSGIDLMYNANFLKLAGYERKHVAFLARHDGRGHINPLRGVAEELVARGYRVSFPVPTVSYKYYSRRFY